MRVYSKDQQDHYIINLEEYGRLCIIGRIALRPALMQHIHGPQWFDIIWVMMRNGQMERPMVCGNYSNAQLRNMLDKELV